MQLMPGNIYQVNKRINWKVPSLCQFCDCDLNKFVLLLRKGVHPYEYMDSWERFDEASLPDTTDKDYNHAQKV